MISLKELVQKAYPDYPELSRLPDVHIQGLECDSRKVEKDYVFVMIRGEKKDGRQFADEAIRRGAVALVGDTPEEVSGAIPFILVPECRMAASRLASAFYGYPGLNMKVAGITGTNGKTTSSYLVEHFLEHQKKKTGVMGTVNYRFAEKIVPAVETTPGPLKVHQILSEMRDAGCAFAVMEVSSHALNQNRVSGIDFETALFTNLTQDHLDYHKTMEAYFECKARLFTGLAADKTAVVNLDDAWGRKLIARITSKVMTYGVDNQADLQARDIQFSLSHTRFNLFYKGQKHQVFSPLVGLHNVYNVLGAMGMAVALGLQLDQAITALSVFKGVPGRLESVGAGQSFYVFIDYAHTPDGLENVLKSLTPYKQRKLIVVFGCGGERDRDKRHKMGRIASEYCDYVYVTSDNPRSEDPRAIAREVCAGLPENFSNFAITIDRRQAIRQALLSAREGDIVLLAGKGHETTQVIGIQALPFSDHEEVRRVLSGR